MNRKIRQFELMEQIGTGSMGIIWRAVQTSLDRSVAVKELHPLLAKDSEFLRRFEREAKTAATLHHENIVGVIEYGQDGDTYYLALEYVEGTNLEDLLADTGAIPAPIVLTMAIDILRGLDHAHDRGVVHRDIKPANVMLAGDGIAKIADFSIAQAAQSPKITQTGAMMGTPAYMSPEQVGGRDLDAQTDLWSVGVILYELLSGERPFAGNTYPTIISNLLSVVPKPLHELDPLIPESISKIVSTALEKDKERRFTTAGQFFEALSKAAAAEDIPHGRALVAEYVRAPGPTRARLREQEAEVAYQHALDLMSGGRGYLTESMRAMERAALLDPNNGDARSRLLELRKIQARGPLGSPVVRGIIAALVIVVAAVGGFFVRKALQNRTVMNDPAPTPQMAGVEETPREISLGMETPTPATTAATTTTARSTGTTRRHTTPRETPAAGETPAPTEPGEVPAMTVAAAATGTLQVYVPGSFARVYLDPTPKNRGFQGGTVGPRGTFKGIPVGEHTVHLILPDVFVPHQPEKVFIRPGQQTVLEFRAVKKPTAFVRILPKGGEKVVIMKGTKKLGQTGDRFELPVGEHLLYLKHATCRAGISVKIAPAKNAKETQQFYPTLAKCPR